MPAGLLASFISASCHSSFAEFLNTGVAHFRLGRSPAEHEMGNSVIRSLPRLPRIALLLVPFSGPAPYHFTGDCDHPTHHRLVRWLEAAVTTRLQPVTANIMTGTFANEEP